jgi:phosphatidylserine/phosphatidylglycerophosphate/cardiolipin synthase-like enzyme
MPERAAAGSSWWADDAHWFPQGVQPRRDTRVEILIDGEKTFRAAWEAIRQARHTVWLADWAMTPDLELVRDPARQELPPAQGPRSSGYRVFDLLTSVARHADVRVLLWSGSFVFPPRTLTALWGLWRLRRANPRIHGRVDRHSHVAHCHHQKTIVVDGRIAFVGGLDMTDFDIDRWDSTGHPVRDGLNWHDVCLRLEGGAAADVARNFIQRWRAVTGEDLALPESTGRRADPGRDDQDGPPLQIVRTIPARTYPFAPQGEFGIAWAYQHAIANAARFIYLENQYLWSPAIVNELIAALRRVDDPTFRIALVLPAQPNIGKRDTDLHLRQLLDADAGRGRVRIFTLYTRRADQRLGWAYKPIYVHAKVAIVDDAWCTVGSANLNQRGMEGDSEINVQVGEAAPARELRLRLWSEHLGLPVETLATLAPHEAIDKLWVPLADHARGIIAGRSGDLPTRAVRYDLGAMPGDLGVGALEARLLDT